MIDKPFPLLANMPCRSLNGIRKTKSFRIVPVYDEDNNTTAPFFGFLI